MVEVMIPMLLPVYVSTFPSYISINSAHGSFCRLVRLDELSVGACVCMRAYVLDDCYCFIFTNILLVHPFIIHTHTHDCLLHLVGGRIFKNKLYIPLSGNA